LEQIIKKRKPKKTNIICKGEPSGNFRMEKYNNLGKNKNNQ
jgi:hypothetical protein